MDLDFTPEQEMLRDAVRGMCAKHASLDLVREMEDDEIGFPRELWTQLGDLGLLGMAVPERWGGSEMSMLDAAIVYEELGRSLAPSPHFVSSILSAGVLGLAGSDAQCEEWLPRIASGEAIVTPAWLEPSRGWGPAGVQLEARKAGSEWRLSGVKRHVSYASSAERLLVLARDADGSEGIVLVLVDPGQPHVEVCPQRTIASETQYRVSFDGAIAPADSVLGAQGEGWQSWDRVMHDGIILLGAQAAGGAGRALDLAVQYSKDRQQFDKPLGAFQAIAHYLADAATAVDGAQTLVWQAAWAKSQGRSVQRLAPMAKLFACQTFRDVTAMAQQVFGGVGFTVEYDIQLYFRRAKQLQISWWDSSYLEELVAGDVLDGAAT